MEDRIVTINVKESGSAKILEVEGRIDTTTSKAFEEKLLEELKTTTRLRIDLKQVVYVSSAGLRAFLNGQKYSNKNKIEMSIFNVNDTVMEVFEMTGFADILVIE